MSSAKRARSSYHHGDLRAALLRAAGELLEEQGPEGIVLREVARRAGVSHNAPYRHFPERAALLAALAAEGFGRLGVALEGALQAPLEGQRGLPMGAAYVDFALAHPQRFRLMFGGSVRLGSDAQLREAAKRAHDGLLAAFRGRSDLADPERAAAGAWALVHGLAQLLLDGHFPGATRNGKDNQRFVREVLSGVRFAGAPQRSA